MPLLNTVFVQATRGITRELITKCNIGNNLDRNGDDPQTKSYRALWDTGATDTGITKNVAEECGLIATDKTIVDAPNGEYMADIYLLDVYLSEDVFISQVRAVEVKPQKSLDDEPIDVLIGMDIISQGDFAISNFQNVTEFAFRHPSMARLDTRTFFRVALDEEEV